MHVTMVKKRLKDGSDCRKCNEATEHLKKRGMLDRIDEVVWAIEGDPDSPGMKLGARLNVERAPFFVVRDGDKEEVYTSVLSLIREHFQKPVSAAEEVQSIDPDDIGGI